VRKKAEREKLPGHECDHCADLYDETFGKGTTKAKDAKDDCSKHRALYRRPPTQPHFWDTSLPLTETQEPGQVSPQPQQGKQLPHTGAGVLPYALRDGRVLLLMHKTATGKKFGRLVDFGGHAEDGEAPEDTAARELGEETGGKMHVGPEMLADCISTTNDRGYRLYFAGVPYIDPKSFASGSGTATTPGKKREYVWVPLASILEGKTELPLFERVTATAGFYSILRRLQS
jgi:ADP-ribose pyrophosphatase YjhB (NUDIX family)